MNADEALAVHQRVQIAYTAQLAELSSDSPDLDRCARLAADIDAELISLPPPNDFLPLGMAARTTLIAAARLSAELLERNRAALLAHRERLLGLQSHIERSGEALRAYQTPNATPNAYFLDQRH